MLNRNIFFCCCCLLLVPSSFLFGQSVRLNEIVSSNSVYTDEDGDTPDWIEIHNFGNSEIALSGWSISDKKDNPEKWKFPEIDIAADGYLLLWASGKDIDQSIVPRTLVNQGDEFRYLTPNSPLPDDWNELAFDDSSWQSGASGIGYADGDDQTVVPDGTVSVFLRKKFNLTNAAAVEDLILHIDYDDGFVAYINGVEVARALMNGANPAYNDLATIDREAKMYQGGLPDRFMLSNFNSILQNGENVLSIQVHNISPNSSDLSVIPFLSALFSEPTSDGVVPPPLLQLQGGSLHTNFKIASAGETIYLYNNGSFVDSITTGTLQTDISIGISNNNELVYFENTTPGLPNEGDGYSGISAGIVEFSRKGGVSSSFSLELSGANPPDAIHYTTDATIPTENSPVYVGPILIQENTVVRARIFQQDFIPSKTQTETYLFDANHQLPIVSLVTSPANFFDVNSGIYVLGSSHQSDFPFFGANFWEDWERPVHFSFYEQDGDIGIALDAGVKIFGGWSRANEQRSFSLFARNQYGLGEMNYRFFSDREYATYQALVLRNSGNDWLRSTIRDGVLTGLMENSELDIQAFQPTVTYVNGNFWGIYNLREKINEHFLASRHNVNPEEIDLLEFEGKVIQGDNQDYLNLIDFIESNTLQSESNYNFVADQIDIDNFIIYNVAQIYFDNMDWPGNNNKFWREKEGKWKWILFDTDFGFGVWEADAYLHNTVFFALQTNGPAWPNPPWSTLLLRKLVTNLSFRNQFINRFADEMNSRFLPERVVERIDSLQSNIRPEINAHHNRWGGSTPFWNEQINTMRTFANRRQETVKQNIRSQFGLPGFHRLKLQIEDPNQGYIKINDRLIIQEKRWEGDYYEQVPISVEVVAEEGFYFSHWIGDINSDEAILELDLQAQTTLIPVFGRSEIAEDLITINEINYQSALERDAGDWIELANLSNTVLNISNWQLGNGDGERFVLPENTILEANGFLVLAQDLQKFKTIYPEVENVIGDFVFDFSANGDSVQLINQENGIYDLVVYENGAPWPAEANGGGPSLELIEPGLNNLLPENWAILHLFGTPGKTNQGSTIVDFGPVNIIDLKYFPNPFTEKIKITFQLQTTSFLKASLFAANGALVYPLFEGELGPGPHELEGNVDFLDRGVYFLEIKEGDSFSETSKWLKEYR